jgi:hypothetical protein
MNILPISILLLVVSLWGCVTAYRKDMTFFGIASAFIAGVASFSILNGALAMMLRGGK